MKRTIWLVWCVVLLCLLLMLFSLPISAREISRNIDLRAIQDHLRFFSSLDSRVTGYPGADQSATYIRDIFRNIGLRDVMFQEFEVYVPVTYRAEMVLSGTEESIKIYPLWPNSVRVPSLPEQGFTGNLVYVGHGDVEDYDGVEISGNIVLMEFDSGTNWITAANLGASAIVFIEPKNATRSEAEQKILSTPVNIPRFWLSAADAEWLIQDRLEATKMEVTPRSGQDGSFTSTVLLNKGKTIPIVLYSDVRWEKRIGKNVLGYVEGTDIQLKQEIVIIHANYDSMSIVPDISPGAEQSVSISMLLEMAKAFELNPPKRSVLFLATAGHGQAMAGIRSFVDYQLSIEENRLDVEEPLDYLNQTIANTFFLSLDMTSRDRLSSLEFFGSMYGVYGNLEGDLSHLVDTFNSLASGTADDLRLLIRDYYSEPTLQASQSERDPRSISMDAAGIQGSSTGPGEIRLFNNLIPLASEVVTLSGGTGISFVTPNDNRMYIDTPHDVSPKVDARNVHLKAQYVSSMIWRFLQLPSRDGFPAPAKLGKSFWHFAGDVYIAASELGLEAVVPVEEAMVVVRNGFTTKAGVRGDFVVRTDEEGAFHVPGIQSIGSAPDKRYMVEAYLLDRETGRITHAANLSTESATQKSGLYVVSDRFIKRVNLMLFPCNTLVLFDVFRGYTTALSNEIALTVYDAQTLYTMPEFGYSLPNNPNLEMAFSVFLPLDSEVKLGFGRVGRKHVSMLTNATADNPEGLGLGIHEDTALPITWFQIIQDMWWLNDLRISTMKENGVEQNYRIRQLHSLTTAYIEEIYDSLAEFDYTTALDNVDTARNLVLEVYPFMRETVIDVVKGFLFYLALLLPFTFVLERLIFNHNVYWKRLLSISMIFLIVVLMLKFVHPAFGLIYNPWVLILGFLIFTLLLFALGTVYYGYQKAVSRRRRRHGVLENVDMNRSAAFAMAFSLGVANMRRRRLRTILTSITLVMLMFLLMSFTSVMPHLSYTKSYVGNITSYDGLLIRGKEFEEIPEVVINTIATELEDECLVVPRSWYTPPRRIDLTANGITYQIKGVMGLTSEEIQASEIRETLLSGRWFDDDDIQENPNKSSEFDKLVALGLEEEFIRGEVTVISSDLADIFGIGPEDLGKTFLTLNIPSEERDEFGRLKIRAFDLLVIGIFDSQQYAKVKDIDCLSLTPMDLQRVTGQSGSQEPADTIIVPFETAIDLGGAARAVLVRPMENIDFLDLLNRVLATVTYPVYVAQDGISYFYSPAGVLNMHRAGELAIPVGIVCLIVLNVMLGSVYERLREISIYTALGLSPTHIGGLFLAESCAYAVTGGFSGYVIGQLLAKIVVNFGLFPGLSLNYSSLAAVGPLGVVMGVVVLSTLYPARMASSRSAPTIERRWRRPIFTDDKATIVMPFVLSRDESLAMCAFFKEFFEKNTIPDVGNFVSRNVRISKSAVEHGSMFVTRCEAHIPPYDLGVNQIAEVRFVPEIGGGTCQVILYLERLTGDLASWQRNAYPFIGDIRRQFLLWRAVSLSDKDELEQEGKKLLGEGKDEERTIVEGEPIVVTDKSVFIRLLDNITIRLRKNFDEIIGFDQISHGELPLRNPVKPIRPVFESSNGIRYTGWKYVGIDRQGESVILHTRIIGKKSVYERRLDPLQNPILADEDLLFRDKTEEYAEDLDIVIIPYRLQVQDHTYIGFGYQYKLTSSSGNVSIDTLYEASTWELGGMAEGKTLILPGLFNEPEFVVTPDADFSTGNNVTMNIFGQFLPRFGVLECFDFQYSEVGALLIFYEEPSLILSNVRKLKESRSIEYFDKIRFKPADSIETSMKYVLVSSERYTRSGGRNQWTACRDAIYGRYLAKFEMIFEEPVPTLRYDILFRGITFEQVAKTLPILKEWGIFRFNLGPIWKSDYTEKCGIIYETGDQGNPYAIWDLEVAAGLGGDKGLQQLCTEAGKDKISVMAWIKPALSKLSPLFEKNPAWKLVHVDGWMYTGNYSDVYGLNMNNSDVKTYICDKVKGFVKSIGLRGLVVGRYPIFGVMPVHYGNNEITPQFPGIIETLAELQKMLVTITDAYSPFALSSWAFRESIKSVEGKEFAYYNKSPEVNADVFAKGELSVEQYFKLLANKVALTFVWSGDKPLEELLPSEIKEFHNIYRQGLKKMERRILLPDDQGVEWKNNENEESLIWAFKTFDCQIDLSREVIDLITGDRVELDEYGSFQPEPMHVYQTAKLFGGKGYQAKVYVHKDGIELMKQVREVSVRVVEELEEDAVAVIVTYGDIGHFVQWLFKLGDKAEIMEPQDLRDQIKEFGKIIKRMYEVKEGGFV